MSMYVRQVFLTAVTLTGNDLQSWGKVLNTNEYRTNTAMFMSP